MGPQTASVRAVSFGFSIRPLPKDALEVSNDAFAKVFSDSRGVFHYAPLSVRALSENDSFRIGKIIEAYQAIPEITETGEGRRAEISKLVDRYARLAASAGKGGSEIPKSSLDFYESLVFSSTGEGLGPFEFLMGDPEIEEIMVNGTDQPVYVFHKKHGMCETQFSFDSREYLVEKANQMLFSANKRVDASKPLAHSILPGGERISVEIPPIAKEPAIDIRRFSNRPLTIPNLVSLGTIDWKIASFLWAVAEAGASNMGVVGNTGGGKTTLLSAILRLVPPRQRVVVVEEIPEISIPHSHKVRLCSVEHLSVSMGDLVRETLRLRPDRVVVGEVRHPDEARALLDSCLSGQAYSTFFTYHSESAQAAVRRLQSQGISREDCGNIGLVVSCRRLEDLKSGRTKRVVTEVCEMRSEGNPVELFRYDFLSGKWISSLGRKSLVERRLCESLSIGKAGLLRELSRREKILKSFSGKGDAEFFSGIWLERSGQGGSSGKK